MTSALKFRNIDASPDDPVARVGLSQVDLIRRVNGYDQAQVRRAAAAHPDDVEAQAKVADVDLAMGKIDEAFDRLLGTVRRTTGEERDQARRHLVSLFVARLSRFQVTSVEETIALEVKVPADEGLVLNFPSQRQSSV